MGRDDEIRRLKRFIVVSWAALLAVILLLVVLGSHEIKNLNKSITILADKRPTVIHGIDGKNGLDGAQGLPGLPGLPGLNGRNGQDGKSVTASQIVQAVSDYLRSNPAPAGKQGAPGQNGRTVTLQVNANNCQLQEKYTDDDNWITIAQLPLPCTVKNESR